MKSKAKRTLLGLGLLCLLGLLVLWLGSNSQRHEVDQMLKRAELGGLPGSASNIAYHQWNRFFTGETYARFELSKGDLLALMTNAPALQSARLVDTYSPTRQRLPVPTDSALELREHVYFQRHPMFPDWFNPTIVGNGREYFIWPDKWLYVDEDRNVIWLVFVKG